MSTISENLQTIADSTSAIKQAIIDKGGTISGDITTWASAISGIETGGGDSNIPIATLEVKSVLEDPHDPLGYLFRVVVHTYSDESGIDYIIYDPVTSISKSGFVVNNGEISISCSGVLDDCTIGMKGARYGQYYVNIM